MYMSKIDLHLPPILKHIIKHKLNHRKDIGWTHEVCDKAKVGCGKMITGNFTQQICDCSLGLSNYSV